MTALPLCRWRGEPLEEDRHQCLCPGLMVSSNGVTAQDCVWCEEGGIFCDREPGPGESPPEQRKLPCHYLGAYTGEVTTCGACNGKPNKVERFKLYQCEKHGKCTLAGRTGHASCATCTDHIPRGGPYGGTVVRNLVYHLWPVRGNGVWQWHVEQLRKRMHLFTGKRVVAIVEDDSTDSADAVKEAFGGDIHTFIEQPNVPELREVSTFHRLFHEVKDPAPNQITFYAHGKGTRYPFGDYSTVHRWAGTMYEVCLDYAPLSESFLQRYALVGPFKKLAPVGHSSWHYGGTYFWLRNNRVFTKPNWGEIESYWCGMEAWPGLIFRNHEECAGLFGAGGVETLYARGEWDRLKPEIDQWKKQNAGYRSPDSGS